MSGPPEQLQGTELWAYMPHMTWNEIVTELKRRIASGILTQQEAIIYLMRQLSNELDNELNSEPLTNKIPVRTTT